MAGLSLPRPAEPAELPYIGRTTAAELYRSRGVDGGGYPTGRG